MSNDTNSERNLVAERAFTIDGKGVILSVRFYKPFRENFGDYRCEYDFIGENEEYSGFSAGIDAMDALDNAFWMVGTKLAGLNESKYGGKLHWDGSEPNKPIGLPVITGNEIPFKNY